MRINCNFVKIVFKNLRGFGNPSRFRISINMKYILFIISSVILFGCSSSTRFTLGESDSKSYEQRSSKSIALESVHGTASYYADQFHGRKTANGETYNMNDLTAAHKSYPFNTIVRVTNLSNNKSVEVKNK